MKLTAICPVIALLTEQVYSGVAESKPVAQKLCNNKRNSCENS